MNLSLKVIEKVSDDETPLVNKVEEAMRLGFNTAEGAKLVGIYDDGYRVIASLIALRDRHKDPDIRSEAYNWLNQINEQNGIGRIHSLIKAFLMKTNIVGKKLNTWTKVQPKNDSVGVDVQLNELMARPDVNENVKMRIDELLASIVEKKIPSHNYREARRIITAHRISKRELVRKINRRTNEVASFVHATEHACMMCDNLNEVQRTTLSATDRQTLIARLCTAAHTLLEIQRELIEGEDNGN